MPNRPTVLVVEDDSDLRNQMAELLTGEGFAVRVAADGAEAINILDEVDHPCVVLADLLMPGIVGQELLEYLRSNDELAEIEVAVVSGAPHLAPRGVRVFRKPLDSQALVAFVRTSCDVRRP